MDFRYGFCCFVPSVNRFVDFTGVQFADHCNHDDVIPVLEWTQVNVALGFFVALCSIRGWVSWIFLVWSFAGHSDQDGCAMCFQADILLEILRVRVSG